MLNIAIELAEKAGDFIRSQQGDARILSQQNRDIKMDADRQSEALIVGELRQRFPEHAIIGEEDVDLQTDSDYRWIVDPIDGTYNYARKYPAYCVSIGCWRRDEPYLGVIHNPSSGETYAGGVEWPATRDGQPIQVSDIAELNKAHAVVEFGIHERERDQCLRLFQGLHHDAEKVRTVGSAALDMAYVACGCYDLYLQIGLSLWDFAAGAAIVQAAGGKIRTFPHQDSDLIDLVCTNQHLFEEGLRRYHEAKAG